MKAEAAKKHELTEKDGKYYDKNGKEWPWDPEKKDFIEPKGQQELGNEDDDIGSGAGKAKGSHGAKRSAKSQGKDGVGSASSAKSSEWTAEKKAKPYRLQITFALRLGATSTGTVVTPDGKTHTVNVHTIDRWTAKDIVGNAMIRSLKADGWTNVTLENSKFDWSSDGSAATGKVDKPKGAEQWTKEKKAAYNKPHQITFAVSPSSAYSGSATVTTPDGKLHQVTTGPSLSASRARKDLVKQMIQQLKNDGWTQAKVTNPNWPEDCA